MIKNIFLGIMILILLLCGLTSLLFVLSNNLIFAKNVILIGFIIGLLIYLIIIFLLIFEK